MSFLGVFPLLISLFDTDRHMSNTNQKTCETCDPHNHTRQGAAHNGWKMILIER